MASIGLVLRWFHHREQMARIAADRDRLPVEDARLARLEHAMEDMALEMERIGEGQRYVTRLLSEQAGANTLVARESR
jgi:hypothetical protein